MKTEIKNTDKPLEIVQKNNFLLKSVYSFQLKDNRQIKVIFSDNPNAQTVENALVKIATRRIS